MRRCRLVALSIFLTGVLAIAGPQEEKAAAEALFKAVTAEAKICDCFELSDRGPFGIGSPGLDTVKASDLGAILDKYNLHRGNGFLIENARFNRLISQMKAQMKKLGIVSFSREHFVKLAADSHRELKRQGVVGECYSIESMFNLPKTLTGLVRFKLKVRQEAVPVSTKAQSLIESVMKEGSAYRSLALSKEEEELVKKGVFTDPEIRELRAIRKAAEILQRSTYLMFTLPGEALTTNNISGFLGNRKQACSYAASTNRMFLISLDQQGFLKHFTPTPKSVERLGHAATGIARRGEAEPVAVIDSWKTWGGEAPNLTLYADWKKRRDWNNIVPVMKAGGEELLPRLPSRAARAMTWLMPTQIAERLYRGHFTPARNETCARAFGRIGLK